MEFKIITTIVFCALFLLSAAVMASDTPFKRVDAFCNAAQARIARPFVRVYFYTSAYCSPCQIAQKAVDKVKKRHKEIIQVEAGTEVGERFSKRFNVQATPTFVCVLVDPITGKETLFDRWSGAGETEKKIDFVFKNGVKPGNDRK